MFIESIQLKNILSFGEQSEEFPLKNLNVLLGPNGSGKSNLIECISLLQATPRDLTEPIRMGGGVLEWLHKPFEQPPQGLLKVATKSMYEDNSLSYEMAFSSVGQRFELTDERIENKKPDKGRAKPYLYFGYEKGQPFLNVKAERRQLQRQDIDFRQSILAQRKDPDQYPELYFLGEHFKRIKIYRDWGFGPYTTPRMPQKVDLPSDFLAEDASNLALVLNKLRRIPEVKARILECLKDLYEEFEDFDVSIEGGTIQVFFQEGRAIIPATRLSDGTLRYLCLLCILLDPNPPSLICIEEPENCLHPDMLPALADLFHEASQRTQLIITTHSDILIDSMSSNPEDVVVCEKQNGATTMKRLEKKALRRWLDEYSLGTLWRKGEVGGNRW